MPIVPAAILFDLLAGGNKDWGRYPPYREFGYEAAQHRGRRLRARQRRRRPGRHHRQPQGRHRLGLGGHAATASPSARIVAVNAAGTVTIGDGPHFWAAPFEQDNEFGGRGWPHAFAADDLAFRSKGAPGENTTLAVVATDAKLTKAQANRLAVIAQTGLARAIYPVHTPLDGDVVFAAATGAKPLPDPVYGLSELGMLAANVLARAVARGVYEATALPFPGALPSWKDKFGG